MNKTGIIYGVNGPVIYLKGDPGFKISEYRSHSHLQMVSHEGHSAFHGGWQPF